MTLGKIKIEDEVKVHLPKSLNKDQTNNTHSSSIISIPDLNKKINPEYGNIIPLSEKFNDKESE